MLTQLFSFILVVGVGKLEVGFLGGVVLGFLGLAGVGLGCLVDFFLVEFWRVIA